MARKARIAPEIVKVDSAYQRGVNQRTINRIKNNYNKNAIHIPIVSLRKNGDYYWLDGQHRGQALVELGLGAKAIEVLVYEGLTKQQEAVIFLDANAATIPSAIDKYLAGVVAKRSPEVEIDKIVRGQGFEVCNVSGGIKCVDTVRAIFKKSGAEGLKFVLDTIACAWPSQANALHQSVVGGLGYIYARAETHPNGISTTLHRTTPGIVMSTAKMRQQMDRMPMNKSAAFEMAKLYNLNRRKNRLVLK